MSSPHGSHPRPKSNKPKESLPAVRPQQQRPPLDPAPAETWPRGRSRRNSGLQGGLWIGFRTGLVAAALVIVLILWAVLARLFAPTATSLDHASLDHFDTLIVLGDPSDADGNPTPTQLARVNEAVHEYERGRAQHIIITGGAAHNQFVEAETMARAAEAEGVPASAILLEPQAKDTIQNACYSVRIMQQRGWTSAEVISSPSHLPRAAMIFKPLPIEWQMHPAPPLTPDVVTRWRLDVYYETLATVRFLTWARLTERCQP